MAVAGCLLPACAEPSAVQDVEVLSKFCGMGLAYEWDGTPESTLKWFTEQARELEGEEADPTRHLVPEDDPVLSMIVIRALNALLEEARAINVDSSQITPTAEPWALAPAARFTRECRLGHTPSE